MKRIVVATMVMATTLAVGCGSSSEESKGEGTTPAAHEEQPTSSVDPNAIPPEKFDEIDKFFRGKAAELQFTCYDRVVEKTHKKYEGHVSLNVIVQPGGHLGDIKVVDSTIGSPEIQKCVVDEIRGWSWPDVPANAPYTAQVNFKPAW